MLWCLRLWCRCCVQICFSWVFWLHFVIHPSWFQEFHSSLSHHFQSHFCLIPALFHHVDLHHTACCRLLQKHWQFPFLTWWLRLSNFCSLVMRTLLLADLIPGMFLIPLKSSSICWIYFCLFVFFVPDAFLCLLTSFNRCFSSFGVVLLSSISLLISAFSFEITSLDSSIFFAVAASFVSACSCSIVNSSS